MASICSLIRTSSVDAMAPMKSTSNTEPRNPPGNREAYTPSPALTRFFFAKHQPLSCAPPISPRRHKRRIDR